ncbi:hypothetical protein ASF78_06860 [Cellulomonas sp. Leaf334]|nr:hypothetical protein ASF78_06860 [Cellulomonas sp. Leaf334]
MPLALLVALAIVVPAGQAAAAGELELSDDGTTWSSTLTGPLFPTPELVVPGDVVASALWVRNASTDAAQVRIDVADDLGVTPGTFAGDLALSIDGDPVSGGARWDGPVLVPGAAVRIPLVVSFSAASQSTSQLSAAAVLDGVLLVQTGAAPGPTAGTSASPSAGPAPVTTSSPTASGASPHGGLARTGQDVAGTLVVSLVTAGVGVLLLVSRRRVRRGED